MPVDHVKVHSPHLGGTWQVLTTNWTLEGDASVRSTQENLRLRQKPEDAEAPCDLQRPAIGNTVELLQCGTPSQ